MSLLLFVVERKIQLSEISQDRSSIVPTYCILASLHGLDVVQFD